MLQISFEDENCNADTSEDEIIQQIKETNKNLMTIVSCERKNYLSNEKSINIDKFSDNLSEFSNNHKKFKEVLNGAPKMPQGVNRNIQKPKCEESMISNKNNSHFSQSEITCKKISNSSMKSLNINNIESNKNNNNEGFDFSYEFEKASGNKVLIINLNQKNEKKSDKSIKRSKNESMNVSSNENFTCYFQQNLSKTKKSCSLSSKLDKLCFFSEKNEQNINALHNNNNETFVSNRNLKNKKGLKQHIFKIATFDKLEEKINQKEIIPIKHHNETNLSNKKEDTLENSNDNHQFGKCEEEYLLIYELKRGDLIEKEFLEPSSQIFENTNANYTNSSSRMNCKTTNCKKLLNNNHYPIIKESSSDKNILSCMNKKKENNEKKSY